VAAAVPDGISRDELQLAARNHGMPLEALRHDLTPVGLHYLLIHYDVPTIDPAAWRLRVGGRVRRELELSLDDVRAMPAVTVPVTMECAGNGRAWLEPRPVSQPWLVEAVGTGAWTGVPLRAVLETCGVAGSALEVVFSGADRGVEGGVEQAYERSLTLDEALGDGPLLAYALNGAPLPPQHGFPLRLVVPGWYGMTNVKWLERITVVDEPFAGYQQARAYRMRTDAGDPGTPVTRIEPRSLMVPPGIPDFMTRRRFVRPGRVVLEGRAWSGWGPIAAVEVSTDGGTVWRAADLDPDAGRWAWRSWSIDWDAVTGEYELCCRARDATGRVQPHEPRWNVGGYANNAVHRVPVSVGAATH
jgi:DMSO/TMAO reductase YedYZ molybdopterin-dependent catalytic subunit